jgi:Leucine-rich repeat (LRR) protein
MTTLTLISLINSADNGDLSNLKELKLAEKNISKIEDLGACKELRKVELSMNILESFEVNINVKKNILSTFFKGISHNYNLVMINLSHNNIKKIPDLQELANLTVLNLSFNKVFLFDFFMFESKMLKRLKKSKV